MKAKRVIKFAVTAVFIAAEVALYLTFMLGDSGNSDAVKYSGVIVCAVFSLYCCKNLRLCDFLLAGAMVFTVISDWFLLITEENLEIGLATFIIAQLLHFARIYVLRKKRPYVSLISRLLLCCAVIVVLYFLSALELLTALVAVYFCNLLINFLDSFLLLKINKLYALLCLGLLLFICCDICVGLYNFGRVLSISIPAAVINFADRGMWAFYLPSQTLIVLSGEIK